MKKITTILMLLVTVFSFSQNKIAEHIAELKNANTTFKNTSVLVASPDPHNVAIGKVVENATYAKINLSAVSEIARQKYHAIEISVPYNNTVKTIELYRVEPLHENFHIDTDKDSNLQYQTGAYYRGIVKGNPNSVVSMNFFENEMNGIISDHSVQNLVIGKIDVPNNQSDYIIYSDAQMKVLNGFSCDFKDDEHPVTQPSNPISRAALSTRCVTVYFEIDYNLYLANNSSVTETTNWMTSVFNNVQTLYANDDITVSLKSMFIWTVDDPYEGDSSSDYLYQFNEIRPVFDGDVGQLVGIDPGGLGGVAVTINGLCSQNNFSYADVNLSYSSVPTYSWTVMVVTHELGHLLGSRHTHACAWNGNNTAIDGCGSTAGYTEGSCEIGPIPDSGTLMSYCHLIGGVGIDFTNGFGPQPRTAILTAVNNSACLSTDCINTCINTVSSITITNISLTTAVATWTDVGSANSWQISVTPANSPLQNWVTATSPYNITGLQANKYYRVKVRPLCNGGLTASSRETVFATSADWCSGVVITDTGGVSGDYKNMESYTRTLIPTIPGKKITVTFTQFDLEQDYDYLYIYDGPNTAAPNLNPDGFTGTANPGSFVSTAPDGSLTVQFFSDQGVVEAGYAATVSCTDQLGLSDINGIDFTYYPNPTTGMVTLMSKTEMTDVAIYNIAGQLLYQNKIGAMQTNIDISAFAAGTYFFKLRFNDIETNFKIIKY